MVGIESKVLGAVGKHSVLTHPLPCAKTIIAVVYKIEKEYVWWRCSQVWGKGCLCGPMLRHPFPLGGQLQDGIV